MTGKLPPDDPAGLEQTRPRGVLRPTPVEGLRTLTPAPEVARFVEFYWWVSWTRPYQAKVLSHPNVHLVFEEPAPLVYGVDRGLFTGELEGAGQVLGVKFRPGWFRPFAEYVGASPKWVLRRARLHEAAARADAGPVDWATLAAELGYADQAHFVRDFTGAVGVPPGRYLVQGDQR